MDARWKGATFEQALACAIPEGIELDTYACATVSALLAGYYDYYGAKDNYVSKIYPEKVFKSLIPLTQGWTAEGKIDGVGRLRDGRSVLIEAKTTSQSLLDGSDYWLRLRYNLQVLQYVTEARKAGWDIAEIIYDVTRKPAIRPKAVDDLDENGLKIVVDSLGRRIFNKNGKPRQSMGNDENGLPLLVQSHIETPDEYCDRLWADTIARPTFYFGRREVPVLDSDLEDFEKQRWTIIGMIENLRLGENIITAGTPPLVVDREASAWPRNVGEHCKYCAYSSFCLQNIDPMQGGNLPAGFTIQEFNPELYDTTEQESEPDAAAAV
jgi:hypothetical protein